MMKAGTYLIGDLCYVMHSEWDEICNITCQADFGILDGEFTLKSGVRFAMYSTAYGDGCYTASNGAELSVDSGTIGCVLLSDVDFTDKRNDASNMTMVTFTEDFETSSSDGTIFIGTVAVPTEYEEEDDYEDSDEDGDEY